MNTLWAFGNSWIASDLTFNSNTWINQLPKKLNLELLNYGKTNTDQAYAFDTFNQYKKNFKSGDIVILTLSSTSRTIFLNDYNKNKLAIKHYYLYLDNQIIQNVFLENFLYNADYTANKHNVKIIILNCYADTGEFLKMKKYSYKNLSIIHDCLYNISINEMKQKLKKTKLEDMSGESRLNHLCRSNHDVLANKIVDYIEHNIDINLHNGFIENILDFDTKNDHTLCDYEFFGRTWEFT